MRVAIYDRITPAMPAELPLKLTQSCSPGTAGVLLALVVPIALGASVAALAIVHALFFADARNLVAEHPALALETVAALAFLIYLVALPAKRLLDRLATRREVVIADGTVTVIEGGYFRSWTWSEPLPTFTGVAHHVRASLSGTRHELILVHPSRDKSVLLSVAPRTSQGEVDHVAAMLGQNEIPPSELYRFKGLRPRIPSAPLPDAAHA